MVCECLVELAHVFIDKTFTYNIPDNLINDLKVGMRVTVEFGSQLLEGFVLSIHKKDNDDILKDIIKINDEYPILNEELLQLGKFIQKNTLATLMSSYQAMLPRALKARKKVQINKKIDTFVKLNREYLDGIKLNNTQNKIIDCFNDNDLILKSELNKISSSSVNTLINKNILSLEYKENFRLNLEKEKRKDFLLNTEQLFVYDEIINNLGSYLVYLIHGVTGSGKTNIYMKLIEGVINNGKCAILLVPEISLTPQIIKRFTTMFDNIAVLHSGLSEVEKYDEWRKIKEGKVNIVIGARSAIFAPFDNIGIIIIDEEHSSTYKQENNPRYNTIDIAKERCKHHKCPLVLGSATPSLESYARAKKGVYKLLELNHRFNNKSLPKIEIVDMNKEFKKSNSYFSNILINEISNTISKGEQVILFLNRRGYTNTITCKSCGYTFKCPNCDITLTYHKSSNMLRCHYCGYAEKKNEFCPECKDNLKEYGLGTEKVEEELNKIIDGAKIIRMDVDTTTKKGSHEKIINSFANFEYNILLGTQMIAKGLDFNNVTLVGVINADTSLNIPDFRSSENTFQLLSQVSGRSGRSDKEGKVIIQTFNPEHYAIRYSKNNDYISFYNEEMNIRKTLGYPPYYYLCLIRIVSKDYNKASDASIKVSDYLKKNLNNTIILGPSIANIFKLNNMYRFQIILKYKNTNEILSYLSFIQNRYFNDKNVSIEIDFNPYKF